MPGDQQSRWLVNPTYGCRVMSSCKSHENVVQGHLVTLGSGVKNQTEQKNYMSLASGIWKMLIWEYCQYWHGEGFFRVDPPMRELH